MRLGRSQPIRPHLGPPPVVEQPGPPIGGLLLARARGSYRPRLLKPHYGYPPAIVTGLPIVGPVQIIRVCKAARSKFPPIYRPHYGRPPAIPPILLPSYGAISVSDAVKYGLTIADAVKYGLSISDARQDGTVPVAYDIGDIAVLSASITDTAGAPANPTALVCQIQRPDLTELQVSFADGEIVQDDTGEYHYDLRLTQEGTWYYRFVCTGAVIAAEETSLAVQESQF